MLERQTAPDRTLLELEPHTGRSHQLRVHLQAIGHPILRDELYAPPEVLAAAPRLMTPPPPAHTTYASYAEFCAYHVGGDALALDGTGGLHYVVGGGFADAALPVKTASYALSIDSAPQRR